MFDGLSNRAILETLAEAAGDVAIIGFFALFAVLVLTLTGCLS